MLEFARVAVEAAAAAGKVPAQLLLRRDGRRRACRRGHRARRRTGHLLIFEYAPASIARRIPHQGILRSKLRPKRVRLHEGYTEAAPMKLHHQLVVSLRVDQRPIKGAPMHLNNNLLGAHVVDPRRQRLVFAPIAVNFEQPNITIRICSVRGRIKVLRQEANKRRHLLGVFARERRQF